MFRAGRPGPRVFLYAPGRLKPAPTIQTDRGEVFPLDVKAGAIDPTKVVRSALRNAASIAGLLLTTEALVSELPEEKKPAAPMGHDHGMDEGDLLGSW